MTDAVQPTFLDRSLQADFERDGVVVVDLLEPPAVEDLWARYRALDHRHTRDSPFAEGFHTTPYDPRPTYRRAVGSAITAVLAPALARFLTGHQLFFENFAVKLPGAAEVPQHLDWSFVDETRFRSATVWCPLEDTDEENGALGVAIGSHRQVDFIRSVNRRELERYEAIAADCPEHRVIALRPGQAIVMDNRVVHFSPPNARPSPRVVAAGIVAPREADLLHHWHDAEGRVRCYVVDRSFFHHYRVGEPPVWTHGVQTERTATPTG
jgi:hypothetical protein